MEALWTFFLTKLDIVRQLLNAGILGEVRTVHARVRLDLEPADAPDLLDVQAAEAALADVRRWCDRDPVQVGAGSGIW
jgi:hypothetical protein